MIGLLSMVCLLKENYFFKFHTLVFFLLKSFSGHRLCKIGKWKRKLVFFQLIKGFNEMILNSGSKI